jgi:predicted negative regulator of RcsB-dependent stress response
MATRLDLEEQEQLDTLKAFWAQYGNLITWLLIIGFGAIAAFNGWNWWQREQAVKAAALYDQLDLAVQAGDVQRVQRAFDDLKDRHPRTVYAEQGGLLAAKLQFDKAQVDAARKTLGWVADNAVEAEYKSIAKLRLAGLQADAKQFDEALKTLDGADAPTFAALVADRRGDVLAAMGKRDEAKAAYRKAWDAMAAEVNYRNVIEAKLIALGAAPTPSPAQAPSAAAAQAATAASAPVSASGAAK